nr:MULTISPECIES: hypothetical protein [Tepidiphilus]
MQLLQLAHGHCLECHEPRNALALKKGFGVAATKRSDHGLIVTPKVTNANDKITKLVLAGCSMSIPTTVPSSSKSSTMPDATSSESAAGRSLKRTSS